MDFFKVSNKLRKSRNPEKDSQKNGSVEEPPKSENGVHVLTKMVVDGESDPVTNADDDDDDDFIANEVKKRLKELRRNSFMVLIPEEDSCPEEEEEEEDEEDRDGTSSSNQWRVRDIEAEGRQWWGGFEVFYETYCERMLFFDRMSNQQLTEAGLHIPLTPSPRSAAKKLPSPLRCLSLKRIEDPDDDGEGKKLQQIETDLHLYQDVETAYLGRICLTWEALHCQFTQLSCQPENTTSYNRCAQQFQQFQVLLQRFMENEPFEQGFRPEKYARARKTFPNLLQVPSIQGQEEELGSVLGDVIKIIESSILTFYLFLKIDKKKSSSDGIHHIFGNQSHNTATPLQQVQSSLDKKVTKLKDLRKKSKGWKKKSWPPTGKDVEVLFGLIDVKLVSRVLRMEKITKEQLMWCEEKIKKLDFSNGNLQRDPSPLLFPC